MSKRWSWIKGEHKIHVGLKLLTIAPSCCRSESLYSVRSFAACHPVFTSYSNSLILPCHQVCRRPCGPSHPSGPSQKTGAAENAAAAARSASCWAIRAAQRRGPTSSVLRIHKTPQLAGRQPYCSCIIAHLLARSSWLPRPASRERVWMCLVWMCLVWMCVKTTAYSASFLTTYLPYRPFIHSLQATARFQGKEAQSCQSLNHLQFASPKQKAQKFLPHPASKHRCGAHLFAMAFKS